MTGLKKSEGKEKRINTKIQNSRFRLLVAQQEKARRLMIERQLFLGLLQEFRETIERTIDLSEQARSLPLQADETGENIKMIVSQSPKQLIKGSNIYKRCF